MKKTLLFIATATLAVACQMNEIEKAPKQTPANLITIGVTAEQAPTDTRTSLSEDNRVLWSAGDQLTVFGSADLTTSATFTLTEGEEGKAAATFEGEDLEGENLLAVYPASYVKTGSKITAGEGTYTVPVTIPQIQNYATNSFSDKNFLAVGIGTRSALKFKNVMGVVELSIYHTSANDRTVNQIEIISQDNLAGNADITFSADGEPTLNWVSDTTKTLYLKFNEAVLVSKDPNAPTKFYFIAPAGAFAEGFAFNIRSGATVFHSKVTEKENTVIRSTVRQMPVYRSIFSFSSKCVLYIPKNITDYKLEQTVGYEDETASERYYHFCVPKANFFDGEAIDSIALFNYLKTSLTKQAQDSMTAKPETYPDFATAAKGAMRNKRLTFTNTSYNGLTVLDGYVVFDATKQGLTALSNIKASEAKILDHISYDEAGVNFDEGTAGKISVVHSFVKSGNNTYTPCTYFRYPFQKADGFTDNVTEVKYKSMSLSSFKKDVSSDLTSASAAAIKEYFKNNGSTLTAALLTSFNNGNAIYSNSTASAGNSYVIMMQVATETDTTVYVKTLRTMSTTRMWMVPTIVDNKDFKIDTKCKLTSLKYRVAASTNNKTLAEVSAELDKDDEYAKYFTAAELEKLNANGTYTKAYSAIKDGYGRYVYVRATNAAGDVFDFAAFAYVPAS